jgi:hypothetical protein
MVDSSSLEELTEVGKKGVTVVGGNVDSRGTERIWSERLRMPTVLMWKRRSPNAICIPSWRELKTVR